MILEQYKCENHSDFEFKSLLSLLSFVSLQGPFLPFLYYIVPIVTVYSTAFWLPFIYWEKIMTPMTLLKFSCFFAQAITSSYINQFMCVSSLVIPNSSLEAVREEQAEGMLLLQKNEIKECN
jgi:hypothetical protein